MTTEIDCGIDNGELGDARLHLAVVEVRDAVFGAPGCRDLIPAIETNGGSIPILVESSWSLGEDAISVADAAELLGETPEAVRDAVIAVLPAAAEWDWDIEIGVVAS